MKDFVADAWDILLRLLAAGIGLVRNQNDALGALVFCIAADYMTGLTLGVLGKSLKTNNGRLSARISFEGLLKKALMLLVILLAAVLDQLSGQQNMLRNAVTWFYICNEGISLTENLALLGVPIPAFLKNALETMKSQKESAPATSGKLR